MDLASMDPTLRLALFSCQFMALAAVAAWIILGEQSERAFVHQCIAGVGALCSLPALVVAVLSYSSDRSAGLLGLTGGLSAIGFVAVAAAAASYVRSAPGNRTVTSLAFAGAGAGAPVGATSIAPAPLPPAPIEPTRVALPEVVTRVAIDMPPISSDATVVGGRPARITRIAYLIDRSGSGTPYRLNEETLIGRSAGATISLNDPEVSREHAKVKFENDRFILYDLGGGNGTTLQRGGRKRRIHTPTLLNDGDMVHVGNAQLALIEVAPG